MALPFQPNVLIAVAAVLLLGVSVLLQRPRSLHVRIAGWILFGLYWPTEAGHYFDVGDGFNATLALSAPLLTGFLAWQDWRSLTWGENPVALRWLAGTTAIAMGTYIVLFEITPVTEYVVWFTGVQSAWLTETLFGVDSLAYQASAVNDDGYRPTHICLREYYWDRVPEPWCAGAAYPNYAVTIIFACTALQIIMIFVGGIALTSAPWRRKLRAALVISPIIYLLNLFRNAGIVYGYEVKGYTMLGMESFEFMHGILAKGGSLVAMMILAWYVFRVLPQMHENVLDLLDLWKRRGPAPRPGAAAGG